MIMTVAFVLAVVQAWRAQDFLWSTCHSGIDQGAASPRDFSYLEIRLKQQDPIEPVFSGELFYQLRTHPPADSIWLTTVANQRAKAEKQYSPSLYRSPVQRFGSGFSVGPITNYAAIPLSGGHRFFPFDSARFELTITSAPPVVVNLFRLVNRVDGFVLDCASVSASSSAAGDVRLLFVLRRNPLTQLSAIVITGASVAFGLLILRSKTIEALSGAALSSFFSMWSVRSILSSQMHIFPTLLDFALLTASMILLLLVLWRALTEPHAHRG